MNIFESEKKIIFERNKMIKVFFFLKKKTSSKFKINVKKKYSNKNVFVFCTIFHIIFNLTKYSKIKKNISMNKQIKEVILFTIYILILYSLLINYCKDHIIYNPIPKLHYP